MEEDLPKNLGKSIRIACGILLLHLLFLCGIGLLVLFLRGLINYAAIILLAGFLLLGFFAYFFYKKIRKNREDLQDILKHPEFADKNLEFRFLGGLASLRMGDKKQKKWIHPQTQVPLMLESPQDLRIRELTELGKMYEKNLLTPEEYDLAKKQIFSHFRMNTEHATWVELPPSVKDTENE